MDMLRDFILFLAPIAIAQLTSHLSEWLQQLVPWLNAQGMLFKRLFVASVAFVMTHSAAALGNVVLHTDINQLLGGNIGAVDPTDVGALMSAALAYYFHLSAKAKDVGV